MDTTPTTNMGIKKESSKAMVLLLHCRQVVCPVCMAMSVLASSVLFGFTVTGEQLWHSSYTEEFMGLF